MKLFWCSQLVNDNSKLTSYRTNIIIFIIKQLFFVRAEQFNPVIYKSLIFGTDKSRLAFQNRIINSKSAKICGWWVRV